MERRERGKKEGKDEEEKGNVYPVVLIRAGLWITFLQREAAESCIVLRRRNYSIILEKRLMTAHQVNVQNLVYEGYLFLFLITRLQSTSDMSLKQF